MSLETGSQDPYIHQVEPGTYLGKVKTICGISKILYPGSLDDFGSLEGVFGRDKIVYLDVDRIPRYGSFWRRILRKPQVRNLVQADARYSPFSEVFDAVFMQDMHATPEELAAILQTLKAGGVLIFSTNDCGDKEGVQPYHLRKHPLLSRLHFPFHTKYYTTYQKRTITNP